MIRVGLRSSPPSRPYSPPMRSPGSATERFIRSTRSTSARLVVRPNSTEVTVKMAIEKPTDDKLTELRMEDTLGPEELRKPRKG